MPGWLQQCECECVITDSDTLRAEGIEAVIKKKT